MFKAFKGITSVSRSEDEQIEDGAVTRRNQGYILAQLEALLKPNTDRAQMLAKLTTLGLIKDGEGGNKVEFDEKDDATIRVAIEGAIQHYKSTAPVEDITMGVVDGTKKATEQKETPAKLTAVIAQMKATAGKHGDFGFGSRQALDTFLETVPKKLSSASLATIRALTPLETKESYIVLFKDGDQIYLGESAPSSKGADGKEGNGVNIAATRAGKALGLREGKTYSETGSAEALFTALEVAGAKDLIRASKSMLTSLQAQGLSSRAVPGEWLSDDADPGGAWYGYAGHAYADRRGAHNAGGDVGVRALRNVTSELGT